jgi:hypothetical protein
MIAVMTRSLLNGRPVSRIRTSISPSSKRFRRVGANPGGTYVELPRKNSAVCNVLSSCRPQVGRRRRERSAGRKPTEYLRIPADEAEEICRRPLPDVDVLTGSAPRNEPAPIELVSRGPQG